MPIDGRWTLGSWLDHYAIPLLYLGQWHDRERVYRINDSTKLCLRVNSSDKIAVWEIWRFKAYNRGRFAICPEDVVVDIGAHIGAFAVYAARHAPRGQVYAYEPFPGNYRLLEKNKNMNDLDNLHVFNLAVSARKGISNFFTVESNPALNSMSGIYGGEKISVKTVSLDDVISDNRIEVVDYIKIDAEGAEYDVLMNCSGALLRRIQRIVLEYHEHPDLPGKSRDLAQVLRSNGYQVVVGGWPFQKMFSRTGFIKAWRG